MTDRLPPVLAKLFLPRDPLEYKPPLPSSKELKRNARPLNGIASFLYMLKQHKDEDYKRKVRAEEHAAQLEQQKAAYKPNEEREGLTREPFNTLFVSRLAYDVDEAKLKHEMEQFGPVRQVTLVQRKDDGKPRGYAFVEFERESSMKRAYKEADGMRINNRPILVDVERGRTVKNWLPRRLGGGLGGTRIGEPAKNLTHPGREPPIRGGSSHGLGSGPPPGLRHSRGPPPRPRDDRRERGDYRGDRGGDFRGDRGGGDFRGDRGGGYHRGDRDGDRRGGDYRGDRGGDRRGPPPSRGGGGGGGWGSSGGGGSEPAWGAPLASPSGQGHGIGYGWPT